MYSYYHYHCRQMHKPINTSMMHDLIVFIFLLIIYFQMKCSHVMINGKITYKGKEILLLFLLQNGYYTNLVAVGLHLRVAAMGVLHDLVDNQL
jgi:hypothetical protein